MPSRGRTEHDAEKATESDTTSKKSRPSLINGRRNAVSTEYLLVKAADQRSALADGDKVGMTPHHDATRN